MEAKAGYHARRMRGLASFLVASTLVACTFDGGSPPAALVTDGGLVADATPTADGGPTDFDATPACIDGDGDGFAVPGGSLECGPLDCDDDDERAFPGQEQFFAAPRPSGSFDFNCDGDEERSLQTDGQTCHWRWFSCRGSGWVAEPPTCGGAGEYHECDDVGLQCVEVDRATLTMACR